MTAIYTAAEAAALLDLTRQRVNQLAAALDLGTPLRTPSGRVWARTFTAEDLDAMRARKTKTGPRPKPRAG